MASFLLYISDVSGNQVAMPSPESPDHVSIEVPYVKDNEGLARGKNSDVSLARSSGESYDSDLSSLPLLHTENT